MNIWEKTAEILLTVRVCEELLYIIAIPYEHEQNIQVEKLMRC